ncbi:hypothetical protein [Bacillus marasmi]|uniref:hypothetical protein n=1 Tax=Bacillus marasmi TaxID=1926279 RepID=UPI0011C6EDCF|nr:hypothetical protein [Bacillus marasmi]
MYLDFSMMMQVFTKVVGLNDTELKFQSISTTGNIEQPKGLFLPVLGNGDELLKAINHGAIAAVWDASIPIPKYKPTYFPFFLTDNLLTNVERMLSLYKEKVLQEEDVKQMSILVDVELLKEKISTYDNSNQFKQILQHMEALAASRRG